MKVSPQVIPTAVFAAFIAGLTIASVIAPDRTISENENRTLASFPEFSFKNVLDGSFTSGVESYMSDQFVIRDGWVTLQSYAERALLKNEINGVYLGKDGYLFSSEALPTERLDKNISSLSAFSYKYAQKLGEGHVKVAIVPLSREILTDKLPEFIPDMTEDALFDRLNAELCNGTFVDTRGTLSAHKDEYIYYRTDHHWTSLGAYYAYEQLTGAEARPLDDFSQRVVTDEFEGTYASRVNMAVKSDRITMFTDGNDYTAQYDMQGASDKPIYDTDALQGKDKYTFFLGGNRGVTDIKGAGNGTLLVIKDSYANALIPFLCGEYERVIVVDLRYFNANISYFADNEGVTDILVLYSTEGFAGSSDLSKL